MEDFVDIPDLFPGHSKDLFCIPAHYYHSISEVLIPYGIIQDRVRKIARNILKTILEEEDSEDDPTRNICLDAESLILTKEEEEVTILDLMTDEKNDFEDLGDLSQIEYSNPPTPSKVNSKINIKSFAMLQNQRRPSIHLICILKTSTSYLQLLQKIKCPSAKGGYKFFLDLLNYINNFNANRSRNSVQIRVDFIKVEEISKESITIEGFENINYIRGSTVVIVDDVVDTGRIMGKLVAELEKYLPKRILIACLLQKRSRVECYRPHYIGFRVPNKMLVGYALDYNEYFKDLSHICILNKFGLEKYSK